MGRIRRANHRAGQEAGEAQVELPVPEDEAYRGQRLPYQTEVLSGATGSKLLSDLAALLKRRGNLG